MNTTYGFSNAAQCICVRNARECAGSLSPLTRTTHTVLDQLRQAGALTVTGWAGTAAQLFHDRLSELSTDSVACADCVNTVSTTLAASEVMSP
ncbi:hypothetical protein [Bifidobacterium canis]|uniref:hypothetical protein n=1 Tax=Bifidobacterium canis TaxID=2610880 RepID=UPI0012D94691|nr:hypothetical protein [Bifidobacterium canis]